MRGFELKFLKTPICRSSIRIIKKVLFLFILIFILSTLLAPKIQAFDIGANNIGKIDPVGVGSIPMFAYAGTDYVYVCQENAIDSAFLIYDLSSISNPTLVSQCLSGDSRACAVTSDETVALVGRGDYVEVLDISNKSAPQVNQSVFIPGGASIYDIMIVDNLAYIAAHGEGLILINITDTNSASIVFTDDTSYIYGISFDSTRNVIYAAARIYFRVYNLYPNGTPVLRTEWLTESYAIHSVEVINPTRVAFGNDHGLVYLFDSTDLDNLTLLSFVDAGTETTELLYTSDFHSNLLVADVIAGLSVVDFASETKPTLSRRMSSTEGLLRGMHVARYNDYILLPTQYNLLIYRLSDCLDRNTGGIPSFQLLMSLFAVMIMIPVIKLFKKSSAKL